MTDAKAAFEINSWDQQDGDGPGLARATVTKTFTGDVVGTSTAELLMSQADGGQGYVATELVAAEIEGRSGTFVVQHGGVMRGEEVLDSFGWVVPGTGTGDLTGLDGVCAFAHDENGAVFTMVYELP